MIELRFDDFYQQNFEGEGFCLYVMKNRRGDVLYVGISTADAWSRWFSAAGHIPWSGTTLYGKSTIGEKLVNHLPDSWGWKIQLWTLQDCIDFCGDDIPSRNSRTIRAIEPIMIKKLSPVIKVSITF